MATFTWVPSSGSEENVNISGIVAQFGDGYIQRSASGINTVKPVWNVVFNVDDTDATAIIAFLKARKGIESFDWTPPGEPSGKFISGTFKRRYASALDINVVSATFVRVFGE
mgnify:CR=1 FL=1